MLATLLSIEEFFGRIEAAIPRSKLSEMFGDEAVRRAIQTGDLTEFKTHCRPNGEPICWLTEIGRVHAAHSTQPQ